jgi:hypothetical protein
MTIIITACSGEAAYHNAAKKEKSNSENKQEKYLEVEYNESNILANNVDIFKTTGKTKSDKTDNDTKIVDDTKSEKDTATEKGKEADGKEKEAEERAQDKIIYYTTMEIESRKFDKLMNIIEQKLNEIDGYVESSEITSPKYKKKSNYRHATITIKVLKDSLKEFTDLVSENSTVINITKTSNNVSLKYVDLENREKAIKIEQKRLLALIKKSTKADDIITLETRLNNITYELEQYKTQLRTYDNKIKYNTVTLIVDEIDRIVPGKEENKSVGYRMRSGFYGSVQKMKSGFENVAVWFATNCIYLIISIVLIIIVIIVTKKMIKKMTEKNFKKGSKKSGKKTVKKLQEKRQ